MQRHILVILDGSPLAEAALPDAAALARATSSGLTLLQVILPIEVACPGAWGTSAPALARRRRRRLRAARCYLDRIADGLRTEGLAVRTKALEGHPAGTALHEACKDAAVCAIAMATHYGPGIRHPLFGSATVAQHILQNAPVPLLLVRPDDESEVRALSTGAAHRNYRSYRTILVPLDGSQLAEQALRQSQMLATAADAADAAAASGASTHNSDDPEASSGAELALVSVAAATGASQIADGSGISRWTLTTEQDEANRLNLYLQKTARQLRSLGHTVQAHLSYGDPAEEIVRRGEEMDADLIVMATHGEGGLRRLCLGSVAREVAERATAPVLLVRAVEQGELEEYRARESVASRDQRELASLGVR